MLDIKHYRRCSAVTFDLTLAQSYETMSGPCILPAMQIMMPPSFVLRTELAQQSIRPRATAEY